jgi:hypothetical protein
MQLFGHQCNQSSEQQSGFVIELRKTGAEGAFIAGKWDFKFSFLHTFANSLILFRQALIRFANCSWFRTPFVAFGT